MLEQPVDGEMQPVINPAEPKDIVGYVREATEAEVDQALTARSTTRLSGSPPRRRSAPPFWSARRC
jgi:RHH-type proline utilization regulon transcriptional repressor/proline dehydrogenase/delta 1-pyrroline-5-carboxylate dehydrogenase